MTASTTDAATLDSRGSAVPPCRADVFSFTVEVAGHGGFEWVYFGPNSAALFGATLGREHATSLATLLSSTVLTEDDEAAAAFLAAARHGDDAEVELRIRGVDGGIRCILWRVMPRRVGTRLYADGVATDISGRRLGTTHHAVLLAHLERSRDAELLRDHAALVRDANDGVLQRIFAAGLRLRMLQSGLDDTGSHAADAIAFLLEQAAGDLRHTIRELEALSRRPLPTSA